MRGRQPTDRAGLQRGGEAAAIAPVERLGSPGQDVGPVVVQGPLHAADAHSEVLGHARPAPAGDVEHDHGALARSKVERREAEGADRAPCLVGVGIGVGRRRLGVVVELDDCGSAGSPVRLAPDGRRRVGGECLTIGGDLARRVGETQEDVLNGVFSVAAGTCSPRDGHEPRELRSGEPGDELAARSRCWRGHRGALAGRVRGVMSR